MARTYKDLTFLLPDGKRVTVSRHSKDYKVMKQTLYKMRSRCSNPNEKGYEHYGGRGIQCLINTVEDLINAIGFRPKDCSIDRIDNEGDYTLDNIRWAYHSQQQRNTCRSYRTTINGITKSIYDWYDLLNPKDLNMRTVKDRYQYGVRGIILFFPKYDPTVKAHYSRDRIY